jgi:hypothetical protein
MSPLCMKEVYFVLQRLFRCKKARVEVIVIALPHVVDAKETADILAAIAALPTAGGDPSTSHDHDQVL